MKLSEILTATQYPVTIPSTGEQTTFRAFIVKEEKALLIAHESEDAAIQLATLNSVVTACLANKPKALTSFDLEYLFLMIRSQSVGEIQEMNGTCGHCGAVTTFGVDMSKAVVVLPDQPSTMLKITKNLAVKMRYPTVDQLAGIANETNETKKKFKAIAASIETVFFGDHVIHTNDTTEEEIISFLDNRTDEEFEPIANFINTVPTVQLDTQFKCLSCGHDNLVELRTLSDFF